MATMRMSATPRRPGLARAAPPRPMPSRSCGVAPCAASPPPSSLSSPLAAAADVAAARAAFPQLCPADPYAVALVKAAGGGGAVENERSNATTSRRPYPADAAATAWIDGHALRAADLVNLDVDAGGAEYKQVILVGPGLDTRPFRLPWPDGTVFFEVAGADSLSVSAATLAAAGVAVPRSCLLRRVLGDVTDSAQDWVDGLADAGFRGDRLCIVCLQAGTPAWALTRPALRSALAAIARLTARGSFVFGDLPAWVATREDAADLLAEAGLVVGSLERPGGSEEAGAAGWVGVGDGEGSPRWLFASQQAGRSDEELAIWAAHSAAAEEADEDFEGHFS